MYIDSTSGYFHSTTILIQLQYGLIFIQLHRPKLCFMKRLCLFNFNKKYIFIQQNIFIQLFKFPDIDKFLFNKAPPPYPPAAPSLKTWKHVSVLQSCSCCLVIIKAVGLFQIILFLLCMLFYVAKC